MEIIRFYKSIKGTYFEQQLFFIINQKNIEDDCPICYAEIDDPENVACHQCNKAFHLSCLESWFKFSISICPHCRTKWKFEIKIKKQIHNKIELKDYSIMPNYTTNVPGWSRLYTFY
jgi:hypothetical protein